MRISIIVPAYNEEATIGTVINTIFREVPDVYEVIVIDDGSKDHTRHIVKMLRNPYPQIKLICHPHNQGKTAALKSGIGNSKGDIVLIQDADLEYDPVDIPAIVEPILQGKADVVYGSRFMTRRASRVLYFRHYIANNILTFLSNLLTDLNMSDVETGYKAFRGEIIRNMIIETRGFGFEIEVTAKLAKLRCRIFEVPISYYGRTYEEGKKIRAVDGFYAVYYIIKYNLFMDLNKSYVRRPKLDNSIVAIKS